MSVALVEVTTASKPPSLSSPHRLPSLFPETALQAALLEGEVGGESGDGRDGPRRAAALSGVLRLLLLRKAEKLSGMLATDKLTAGPHSKCCGTRDKVWRHALHAVSRHFRRSKLYPHPQALHPRRVLPAALYAPPRCPPPLSPTRALTFSCPPCIFFSSPLPADGPDGELEDLLARLTAAVRLLYGSTTGGWGGSWVVGAELDELAALGGLEAADVEALPAGYR